MKKKNIKYIIWGSVLIAWFIFTRFISFPIVYGHSMENTLYAGDFVLMNKTKALRDPKNLDRFNIIVIKNEDILIIKRVIGLPGETIQIKGGFVYINGSKLEEDIYGAEIINDPGLASEPILIPEDCVFVLGDNRNRSDDSRVYGVIKKENIVGICEKYLFNPNHEQSMKFGTDL